MILGQQRDAWGYPACAPGTFTITLGREPGMIVEYALVRFSGPPAARLMERHLASSVTIPDTGITIHLGYDYSLTDPTLPDTALQAP